MHACQQVTARTNTLAHTCCIHLSACCLLLPAVCACSLPLSKSFFSFPTPPAHEPSPFCSSPQFLSSLASLFTLASLSALASPTSFFSAPWSPSPLVHSSRQPVLPLYRRLHLRALSVHLPSALAPGPGHDRQRRQRGSRGPGHVHCSRGGDGCPLSREAPAQPERGPVPVHTQQPAASATGATDLRVHSCLCLPFPPTPSSVCAVCWLRLSPSFLLPTCPPPPLPPLCARWLFQETQHKEGTGVCVPWHSQQQAFLVRSVGMPPPLQHRECSCATCGMRTLLPSSFSCVAPKRAPRHQAIISLLPSCALRWGVPCSHRRWICLHLATCLRHLAARHPPRRPVGAASPAPSRAAARPPGRPLSMRTWAHPARYVCVCVHAHVRLHVCMDVMVMHWCLGYTMHRPACLPFLTGPSWLAWQNRVRACNPHSVPV